MGADEHPADLHHLDERDPASTGFSDATRLLRFRKRLHKLNPLQDRYGTKPRLPSIQFENATRPLWR